MSSTFEGNTSLENIYLVNIFWGKLAKNTPLLGEASLNNIKIPLNVYTVLSLFQWKADHKRNLVLWLPQVPLPLRAKLGKNLLSEPKARRLAKEAWPLETGKVNASRNPLLTLSKIFLWHPLESKHQALLQKPRVHWLLQSQEISIQPSGGL